MKKLMPMYKRDIARCSNRARRMFTSSCSYKCLRRRSVTSSVAVPSFSSSSVRSRTRSMQRIERVDVVRSSELEARMSTAGVIIADSTCRTSASCCVWVRSGHIREGVAREVLVPRLGDEHVVLDADAAVFAERADLFPIHELRVLARLQLREQRVDEIEARLDREDVSRLDDAREPQVRMPFRLRNRLAAAVGHEAADVMHLQAEVVTDAVGEERELMRRSTMPSASMSRTKLKRARISATLR